MAYEWSAPSGRSYRGSPGSWTPFDYDYMIRAVVDPLLAPVGGFVTPVNKTEILTPYLALAGLVIAISAAVVVRRRHEA